MKKLILIIVLILFSCNFQNEKNTFTLTGKLKNLKDSTLVYLGKIDLDNYFYKRLDSTYVKNYEFEFKGKKNKKDQFVITFVPKKLNDSLIKEYSKKSINLYLENSKININGDFNDINNIDIVGSSLTNLLNEIKEINEKHYAKYRNGLIDYNKYKKIKINETIDLIFKNINNPVSISTMLSNKEIISKDTLKLFYDRLPKKSQNSIQGTSLRNYINSIKIKIGDSLIDFEANDLQNNSVKISDYKDKIILLDFWASWCHYCHDQNKNVFPILKKKYKDLEIISYSADINKKLWSNASKSDKIDWVNLSNLKGVNDEIVLKYNVYGYPTSFLIDKDGIIRDKFIGFENDEIEKSINRILKTEL
ncbi:TlpA disulfide reductase family protein [Wenyingzhuangia sp. chi5]|uniref:TlpA disulfide reductase family protein n=1 Tax=Wenyingzhuangia gilva TaxID=3057677 RepID=A0ABT8VTF7_9FLAO|nr:TlpA disulfide reductase family protein [Wenyingzhuangia sp. chi5]MDO3695215.1 TlpA disulfide reductase family protein [Wenyingzhuangia sp. chi5]